jgi:16S rRNA (guanine527-N7)-methyltransferase
VKHPPLSAAEACRRLGIDAAGRARLDAYLALLERWQRRINLVGAATLADPWRRHILDSGQLVPWLPPGRPRLADLGSGAGFPGLVLAIVSQAEVTLIEADARKCAFLAEAARHTGTVVTVLNRRIESVDGDAAVRPFAVVTARALAPLDPLIGLARPLLAADGALLLLKGRAFPDELTAARVRWKMRVVTRPSVSDDDGVVARIDHIESADDRFDRGV